MTSLVCVHGVLWNLNRLTLFFVFVGNAKSVVVSQYFQINLLEKMSLVLYRKVIWLNAKASCIIIVRRI
jgi:hypothetical protein